MDTHAVQAVFDLLYAFRDEVSRFTGCGGPQAWTHSTSKDKRKLKHVRPT